MSNQYLYEELDVLKKFGSLKEMPEYIVSNLNDYIILRDYQEAFRYFTYYESPESGRTNRFIMFHMATGP